jgi:hypothetical protein
VKNDMDLPPAPMDELMAERVRRRAQAALADERRLLGHPLRRGAARVWGRVEPVAVAAACVVYLVWAIEFASKLYQ